MKHRVVITGMGAITPIGQDIDMYWNHLKEGVCGIDRITQFELTEGYGVTLAAEVKDFNAEKWIDKREARRLDRFSQFAIAAAKQAMVNANIQMDTEDENKVGVIIGSGIGGLGTIEQETSKLVLKGPRRVSPFFVPMAIANMAAGNVAIHTGAKGVCTSVVTACASGTHAVGEAFRHLQQGYQDVILAGGAEAAITPLGIAGFQSLSALSKSEDPLRASIPFDKERNGFVMGEGAGVLVLETLEHAQKRGAAIVAEVVGYGATCDAYHITSPDPSGDGAKRAMQQAIMDAEITPSSIGYINAHGTSTVYNDKIETKAIKDVFGEDTRVLISSTKSMTGHLLGAAGAIEAIALCKVLEEGFVPPTIGYKVEDEECDLRYVPNVGKKAEVTYAMSNSLGFGGHNAVIIMKKWEGEN